MKRLVALMMCAVSLGAAAQLPDYVPTDGLVAWYPLNGDAQEAIHDSLNGMNSTSSSLVEVNRFGQQGGALGFLRQEQTQVVLPPLLDFSDSTFTFSGWFKSTALVPSQSIINTIPHNILGLGYNHVENPGDRHVSLWLNDDNVCCWNISSNGHSDQSFELDTWHHVVVSRNGDAISLFVNGELDWSLTLDNNIGSPLEGLVLGSINGYEFFNGSLDDFGFWQRALTDEEILALFNAPSPTTGCVDENACNYDSTAVIDDESCLYLDACGVCGGDGFSGCIDDYACNFDAEAACDDGSCDYTCCPGPGCCTEGMYWDWELSGCYNINPADINLDGCVQLNDLLDLLSAFGNCGAEETLWPCGDPLEYQGYDYETVQIGEQCWFAENLRAENYRNGGPIPAALSDSEWTSTNTGAMAVYEENTANLEFYGCLYNWYAVDDARGLCPVGWHVPSDEEWTVMTDELGGVSVAGGKMKEVYGWDNYNNGTNSSGFSGLPGGFRNYYYGGYSNVGYSGSWWSSSAYDSFAWHRRLNAENAGAIDNSVSRSLYGDMEQGYGLSVRCIKDTE